MEPSTLLIIGGVILVVMMMKKNTPSLQGMGNTASQMARLYPQYQQALASGNTSQANALATRLAQMQASLNQQRQALTQAIMAQQARAQSQGKGSNAPASFGAVPTQKTGNALVDAMSQAFASGVFLFNSTVPFQPQMDPNSSFGQWLAAQNMPYQDFPSLQSVNQLENIFAYNEPPSNSGITTDWGTLGDIFNLPSDYGLPIFNPGAPEPVGLDTSTLGDIPYLPEYSGGGPMPDYIPESNYGVAPEIVPSDFGDYGENA